MSASLLLITAFLTAAPRGQAPCARARVPAYSHNDYENTRPLEDALSLGFRGVEVDVFLVDGVLRVGHDRRAARAGPTLEKQYLDPLRAHFRRCPPSTDPPQFLLLVEIKESSRATYDTLVADLSRYPDLFGRVTNAAAGPVEVVMVGWSPALAHERRFAIQQKITRPDVAAVRALDSHVRLLSLDYGKTIGRLWVTRRRRTKWLASLRATKNAAPGLLLRVHNVKPSRELYAALLGAGVDLIGAKDLVTTGRLLR